MNSRLLGWTRNLPIVALCVLALSACGGSGGGDDSPPPTGETVTVSGRITFDRPVFNAAANSGLNLSSPVESPAREVVVEALDGSSSAVLATTTTDTSGNYSFDVPANRNIFIRAKAQMLKVEGAASWNFRVLNNTNSDALYALDGSVFNSGAADSTRNLRASTGWGGSSYTGTRAAAPFAILDTVFRAKELVLTGEPEAVFPQLDLFWSPDNRTLSGQDRICADDGDIGTTFYFGGSGEADDCDRPLPPGIYILGAFGGGAGDTDEFDQHVIAHEFGHYYEAQFSRSDSIGGTHGDTTLLDMRVAFGEGWGNAYSAMTLGDPAYRDSFNGVARDFGFSLEADSTAVEGWYSEWSVGEIIWDLYDDAADGVDAVSLGFGPIHRVMRTPQVSTEALTSIYTFAEGLRAERPSAAAALDALLSAENIFGRGEYGEGETNFAGQEDVASPIYVPLALNSNQVVCIRGSADGSANQLGNNRFLRFDNDVARTVTIHAAGVPMGGYDATEDPDIFVYRRGDIVAAGVDEGFTETLSEPLAAGTHVIEVYDFGIVGNTSADVRCMNVSISGS